MNILGIHDGHDCGAAVLKDSKIIAAVNEERLDRQKLMRGFPVLSIPCVMQQAKLEPKDIDLVAVASRNGPWFPKPFPLKDMPKVFKVSFPKRILSSSSALLGDVYKSDAWIGVQKKFERMLYGHGLQRYRKMHEWLKQNGFESPVRFVDHHICHGAAAYYTGNKDNALVVTQDAAGDALSSIVASGEKGEMKIEYELGSYNSIGKYYAYVTSICGFTPNKHEGKITGLAAFGKPIYLEQFRKWAGCNNKGKIVNYSRSKHDSGLQKVAKALAGKPREHIAASVQWHLEETVTKYVSYWADKTGLRDVVLGGGVFANVKLNQRLLELENVDSVFVHPHMGDGGLAVGAAYYAFAEHQLDQGSRVKPVYLDNVYFGPEYGNEEIQQALEEAGVKAKYFDDAEGEIGRLVADKKIVGNLDGRMEYGPRALGNRSILVDPTDKTINDSLNKRLARTEFMPFAPSILDSAAPDFYDNYAAGKYPARFMTITFDVFKKAEKSAKAVVHIDHTARPQVVDKKQNRRYYRILEAFNEITGLPAFVNTSFNAHEEPIICTPENAIRALKNNRVDCIALGNWIAEGKNQ